MTTLIEKRCVPCEGGIQPLAAVALGNLLGELGGGWLVIGNHHLEKKYVFPDFASALSFTNRVGEIAEAEAHHPNIHLTWGQVELIIWTHAVDGLTENDFILAAKADRVWPVDG